MKLSRSLISFGLVFCLVSSPLLAEPKKFPFRYKCRSLLALTAVVALALAWHKSGEDYKQWETNIWDLVNEVDDHNLRTLSESDRKSIFLVQAQADLGLRRTYKGIKHYLDFYTDIQDTAQGIPLEDEKTFWAYCGASIPSTKREPYARDFLNDDYFHLNPVIRLRRAKVREVISQIYEARYKMNAEMYSPERKISLRDIKPFVYSDH